MKSYKDLKIYQESKRLAILVHEMTLKLPKFETYEEGGQVKRSSKSVTSNIVEGYGRRTYKADYVNIWYTVWPSVMKPLYILIFSMKPVLHQISRTWRHC